jgi:hypothetical protein
MRLAFIRPLEQRAYGGCERIAQGRVAVAPGEKDLIRQHIEDGLVEAQKIVEEHFEIGDALRQAGGRNSNYLGVQLQYGW